MFVIPTMAQTVNDVKLIYQVEKMHQFSSRTNNDRFTLSLHGPNIFDGVLTFKIVTEEGKEIYKDEFTTGEMMEFGPPETDIGYLRSKEDSLTITIIMNQFFDERSFTFPAVLDSSEMKDNYTAFDEWNLIYQDPDATGFHYLLGAEDGRSIAYSKKRKKVVVYFTCC